jgi:hypothetical protein
MIILVAGFPGVDDVFWLQAVQLSVIILVAGFPSVDDLFWL